MTNRRTGSTRRGIIWVPALLAAGRPADAEAVFRADLKRNPANGWALVGLQQALAAQKKEAGAVKADLEKAWSRADVQLTAPVF